MLVTTLEQWRMFKAVVEHGGFNQAASKIFKSQSSIHNAVKKIESNLNVELFAIEGKKTTLTSAGELLYRRANYLLDEAAKLESIGNLLAEGIESQLKIAVDEMFPHDWLCDALERTSKAFPFLRVEIIESVLSGATELLDQGQVDLAISPVSATKGHHEELCQIEFNAVSAPDHPLQRLPQPITFETLKLHRQIVIRDSAIGKRVDAGWLGAHQRWTVSHVKTSLDILRRGLGYAWLPLTSLADELKSGQIKRLNLKQGASRTIGIHLVYKDDDMLGPATKFFVSSLRERCKNMSH